VDAIIPLRICHDVIEYTSTLVDNNFSYHLKASCVEFADLIHMSSKYNDGKPTFDILNLLKCCAIKVLQLHQQDTLPDPPCIIPGTYNPAKYGRAFYFTEHGCQIREMRQFSIDSKASSVKYDDLPESKCNKIYPQVTKKGVSYLFLWFCPLHGHCLGYHIIPGSEGRKDAAASLYTHLPTPPEEIFYDFACSLSEYNHNRESGYFKNTRYYHDVFHGFTHKCSKVFRCDRLNGFGGLNTSICEQFNSFIQNIKVSSKLMNQAHFNFYLQFFIHIWNQKKQKSFEKRSFIARSVDV